MSEAEFWDALKAHDWYYNMSDDPRVSRRGRARNLELRRIAEENGWLEMFQAFQEAHSVGGYDESKIPERPE